jgi:phosphocarrier protein HPr
MNQVERTCQVVNPLGLHARAAAQLVKVTARLKCDVTLECDGQEVNGKSIMGVLTLAAAQGSDVKVTCQGPDAADGLEQIAALFAVGFHELKP